MLEFLKVVGPIVLGIAGMVLGYVYQRTQLKQAQREDERKEIYQKLNEFYGPVQHYLAKSNELYKRFTAFRPAGFRTLIALLEGQRFEGNDKVLLEQILEIVAKVEELILSRSGLVDDTELRELLARAGTHFRFIGLAYEGLLVGEADRFKGYVYPRELNEKVDKQIEKLKARLNELNTM